MGKGKFKTRNIDNLTTEQVKGALIRYEVNSGYVPLGFMTHADKDYLYGEIEYNEDVDVCIEFFPNEQTIFTMEVSDD